MTVLFGLLYIICEMYIDDDIVYANGNAQFLERLELVFQRFRLKGLLVKAKKCKFGLSSIEYVGKVISAAGLSMSKEKIESVLNFPRPKDNTSLRALLGLANYFRGFVPEHSTIVAPLHRMIDQSASKRTPIAWTAEHCDLPLPSHALYQRRLPCPPLYRRLSLWQWGRSFPNRQRRMEPIAFVSRSLSTVQLNWSTIQTEAYAIFVCCKQLAYLIRDRPFSIHTDHKTLTFMTKNSSSMVTRWYVALQEFDYTLHFVKGSQNTIADAMSRLCPNLTELALPHSTRPSRSSKSTTSVPSRMTAMSSSSFVRSPDGLNYTGVRMRPPPGRVIAFYSTSVASARPASSALTADPILPTT
jgi:hypothetical protein